MSNVRFDRQQVAATAVVAAVAAAAMRCISRVCEVAAAAAADVIRPDRKLISGNQSLCDFEMSFERWSCCVRPSVARSLSVFAASRSLADWASARHRRHGAKPATCVYV